MGEPSLTVIEEYLTTYCFPRLLQLVQFGICKIYYIEKSIKYRKNSPIQDKIAFGISNNWPSSQEEILNAIFRDMNTTPEIRKEIQFTISNLPQKGYLQNKHVFHIGKELHTNGWRSELYVPYEHKTDKYAYGIGFELETLECSHYEVMKYHWIDVLTNIRSYFKNTEYTALCHVLGHIPIDTEQQHLRKSDPRYLYSLYFSVFLPYEEIANDLQEVFYVFTKQKLTSYLSNVEGFPIVSIIHVSQEVEEPPQCTVYFRKKHI